MNGVHRADRLRRKAPSRTLHDLLVKAQQRPSCSDRVEAGLPMCGVRLLQFIEGDCAEQHPIAFDQGEIGTDDQFSLGEPLGNQLSVVLFETLKRYRVSGHRRRLWVSTQACQDMWHSAWHFWWCAAVSWGDSWRITCCEVFEFSEELAGSHEKAGHDSAGS